MNKTPEDGRVSKYGALLRTDLGWVAFATTSGGFAMLFALIVGLLAPHHFFGSLPKVLTMALVLGALFATLGVTSVLPESVLDRAIAEGLLQEGARPGDMLTRADERLRRNRYFPRALRLVRKWARNDALTAIAEKQGRERDQEIVGIVPDEVTRGDSTGAMRRV